MIRAQELALTYPTGTKAILPCDFEIKSGELVFLIGPSGSGKTSLLKLFMGSELLTEGSLEVLGQSMTGSQRNIQKMRQWIGPIFQDFRLIPNKSALENVMLGLRFLPHIQQDIKAISEEALIRVGLSHKIKSHVDTLSWGESQRVAIARAMVREPKLILADEPTGNLDKENAVHILKLLMDLRDSDTTVILTTHATHLIEDVKNAVFIHMNQGQMFLERR